MLRYFLVFAALCAILVMSNQVGGVPDKEGEPLSGATYIGEKSCKKCHMKQHRSWRKMKHNKAWKNLPDKYKNLAEKDEAGRVCASCHVTGWGEPTRNGFVDAEKSKHLLGVQCEACHGPGSKHKEAGQRVLDEKRKKFEPGEPTFTLMKTTKCSECHNPHVSHAKYKEGG